MAGSRRAPPPCRKCMIIRLHLMISGPLLILMAFFPEAGSGLGDHLPPPEAIAALIPMVAIPTFVIRFVRWHRDGRP